MKKADKLIPKFKSGDEEREFWATHSPLDYFDSGNIKRALFPNLTPSFKSTSIRLPEDMIAELKTLPKRLYPKFGNAAGLIEMSDDFDEPLEDFKEYMP
jgi:hypothetical protein